VSANEQIERVEDITKREVVLRADFDLLDEDGCAWISTRFLHGPRAPEAGNVVYLLDGEGCGCVGYVQEVSGWYACVRPDWDTFVGGSVPRRQTGNR
jgi:hypothetical protein